MAKLTLVLILMSISTLARASEWKYIARDIHGNTNYVDAESVLVQGDTRTYWRYVKLKEPQTANDKIFYTVRTQESINCAKRTFRVLVTDYLDSKGTTVDYQDFRESNHQDPIPPDTVYDAIRKYVCSIKKTAE